VLEPGEPPQRSPGGECESTEENVMEDAGFIIGSYVITFGGIAVYAITMLRRARRLAAQVPDEEKPWI
jgi:hypothetical protein